MANVISDLLDTADLNLDSAGLAVLGELKRRRSKDRKYTERYLGIQIGKLRDGATTWWRKRPEPLNALAEILGTTPDALLTARVRGVGQITFAAFPEMRPLGADELPCALTCGGRPLVDVLGPSGSMGFGHAHLWIVAPAGAGKSLAADVWSRRVGDDDRVIHARTLTDAIAQIEGFRAAVIDVDRADPERDALAVVELSRRLDNLRVLAAFSPPPWWTAAPPNKFESIDPVRELLAWRFDAGWRRQFVDWVWARLPQPDRFEVDKVMTWLAAIDSRETLFDSPGALLPVLAYVVAHPIPHLDHALPKLTAFWPERACAGGDAWVRAHGAAAMRAMVRGRLDDLGLRYAPLSVESWGALVPSALLSRATAATIDTELENVAHARSDAKRRSALEQAKARVAPATPTEAVDALVRVGLLRTQADGWLDVHPRWIGAEIDRAAVHDALVRGRRERWAVFGVERVRRGIVDAALDGLKESEFLRVMRGVHEGYDGSLVSVGAVEALFAASGRRLVTWRPSEPALDVLQVLGAKKREQLDLADSFGVDFPRIPLTRAANGRDADGLRWHGEAWIFSLRVPGPGDVSPEERWTFPGWAAAGTLFLSEIPSQSSIRHGLEGRREMACALLMEAAPDVVARVSDEALPADLGTTLLPAVLFAAADRGWTLHERYLRGLLHGPAGIVVAGKMQEADPRTRASLAQVVWQLAIAESKGEPFHALLALRRQPVLHAAVLDALPDAAFGAACVRVDWRQLGAEQLDELPKRLRLMALGALADKIAPGKPMSADIAQALQQLDVQDLDLLVRFGADQYTLGGPAAERVWALDPGRALDETRRLLDATSEASFTWLQASPPAQLGVLVADLETRGDRLPWWVYRWGARALATAGAHAERLFGVMRRVQRRTQ